MPAHEPRPEGGGFWNERKNAAVFKHAVLDGYLPVFATKTGTYSRGHRVVYFDGYAGQGRYDDGTEGSPVIAAKIAETLGARTSRRGLELFLVEQRKTQFRRLAQVMAQMAPASPPMIRHGDAGDFIDEVLGFAADSPLFALLDPYGLGLPMRSVVQLMKRPRDRSGRPPTEVLINFSDIAVRRIGGLLTAATRKAPEEVTLMRMDDVCGGNWWRAAYTSERRNANGVAAVVDGYRRRLCGATGSKDWTVPVRNRAHQEPRYFLVFLTRHPDGLWEFGENVSRALAKWRNACDAAWLGVAPEEVAGALLLDSEDLLEHEWIKEIEANITGLIASRRSPFAVRQQYAAILGSSLGLARSMHIRTAVKNLYERGVTETDGKGDVATMIILPPHRPSLVG